MSEVKELVKELNNEYLSKRETVLKGLDATAIKPLSNTLQDLVNYVTEFVAEEVSVKSFQLIDIVNMLLKKYGRKGFKEIQSSLDFPYPDGNKMFTIKVTIGL